MMDSDIVEVMAREMAVGHLTKEFQAAAWDEMPDTDLTNDEAGKPNREYSYTDYLTDEHGRNHFRNLARTSLAALRAHGLEVRKHEPEIIATMMVQRGMVVVPVEPTEAMIEAAFSTMTGSERDYGTTIKKEWAAMITAANPRAGK